MRSLFHKLSSIVCFLFILGICTSAQKLATGNEVQYRSPIRYVIVYNDIFEEDQRRMVVLMDAKDINKRSLTQVFRLIAKRFPAPKTLMIQVETNLALVETPEEREMLKDSEDSRFKDFFFKYKNASYERYEAGREAFLYTKSLSPYKDQVVVLVNKPWY